ncbi:response regulator [Trichocoleus sp. DQ-A3]|uniref:response regulator n=1 Tax=Cyanophyceae TaxID=3028117 RepID=UPI001684C9A7|nr:response regulator [Coleofasciculus sp. FACHB-125]MBD1901166.1 response regulator [Coleofasciculus sp. FACHB-125]
MQTEPIAVLLVEDNPGDARLVRELLREVNAPQITLIHVQTLTEALDCLVSSEGLNVQKLKIERFNQPANQQPFELKGDRLPLSIGVILLDLSLPDAQGLETVRRVCNAVPEVPIVVMSGLADEAIALSAVQEGAQDYLVKGHADSHLLLRTVRYAIERQRMQIRLQQTQRALQQQLEREALVNRITTALNSNLDPKSVVDEIVRQTAVPMSCDFCMVVRDLSESNRVYIEAEYWPHLSDAVKPISQSPLQGTTLSVEGWETVRSELLENRPVAIINTTDFWLTPAYQALCPKARPSAMLLSPIFVREQFYGYLVVGSIKPRPPFLEWEIQLLQQLAGQTAIALYNAHELEQLESLVQERTQQLAQEKTLLEAILDSIQEGITVTQPDGQIVLLNRAALQIYGLVGNGVTPTSAPGSVPHVKNFLTKLKVRHPDGSRPRRSELPLTRALQGEVFTDQELVVHGLNGERKWVSINGAAIRDDRGKVLLAVNTTRDITERKQAEKALRESETKFRTLYESTSAAVMLLDEQGFFDCNSATLQLFGCNGLEEFCGKHLSEFSPPTQPDGQNSLSLACDRITTALTEGNCRFDWIYRKSDGKDFPAEVTLTAIELDNRKVLQAVVYDISDRMNKEIELREAKEAAEAGSRAKSEFLATMSHELRTPLNAILGLSHIMRQEIFGTLNEKQKEYVTCINNSGEHLLSLINDILDLSKVEAGKEQLCPMPIIVPHLCEYIVTIMREQAYERGLQLTSEIDPEIDVCVADERRLKQMLLNLLSNAIKFTPSGQVSLIVQKQPGCIAFTVADTGIGIAPEKLSLLFEPFRQLDSGLNRQFAGTGLGLSLTRSLARLHGGDVTVSSTLGKGSEFTLYLPDMSNESVSIYQFPSEGGDSSSLSSGLNNGELKAAANPFSLPGKRRILIVEDDENSGLLLQDYLQVVGHTVEHLLDGTDFLQRVRNFQPDLILLDVNLPGGYSGLDLLKDLKQQPELERLPVVMVTVNTMAEDRDRFLEAGANDYLSKPIGIPQLELILMKHL